MVEPASKVILAKNAPVILPVIVTAFFQTESLVRITAVIFGLVFGAMWRAGSLRSEGKGWSTVRSDLAISLLVGGANAILALALVEWLGVSQLLAMAIGVIVGATGLRAVPEARDLLISALRRKLIGEDVIYIQPKRDEKMQDDMNRLDHS